MDKSELIKKYLYAEGMPVIYDPKKVFTLPIVEQKESKEEYFLRRYYRNKLRRKWRKESFKQKIFDNVYAWFYIVIGMFIYYFFMFEVFGIK